MAQEKDVVLIYFEDKPLVFARIEDISPDIKKDWYHVKLLMLQIPLQTATWILKNEYINGNEFTMNAKKIRLELVACPEDPGLPEVEETKSETTKESKKANVISLADRKK